MKAQSQGEQSEQERVRDNFYIVQETGVEDAAKDWVNDSVHGYPDEGDTVGVWMFNKLIEAFIAGAKWASGERIRVAINAWDAGFASGHADGADISEFTKYPNKEQYFNLLNEKDN